MSLFFCSIQTNKMKAVGVFAGTLSQRHSCHFKHILSDHLKVSLFPFLFLYWEHVLVDLVCLSSHKYFFYKTPANYRQILLIQLKWKLSFQISNNFSHITYLWQLTLLYLDKITWKRRRKLNNYKRFFSNRLHNL